MDGLAKVSGQFREILKLNDPIKEMCAKFFKNQKSLLLLGRGSQFSTALEGTLIHLKSFRCRCRRLLTCDGYRST